jgi:hypothetical protein
MFFPPRRQHIFQEFKKRIWHGQPILAHHHGARDKKIGLGSNIGHGLFVGWVEQLDIFCWVSFLYPTYLPAIFVISAKPNKLGEDKIIPKKFDVSRHRKDPVTVGLSQELQPQRPMKLRKSHFFKGGAQALSPIGYGLDSNPFSKTVRD